MNRFLNQRRSYRLAELFRFGGDGFAFLGAFENIDNGLLYGLVWNWYANSLHIVQIEGFSRTPP